MDDSIDKIVGSLDKMAGSVMKQGEDMRNLALAQWIVAMCLQHGKEPEEIIKLLTRAMKVLRG